MSAIRFDTPFSKYLEYEISRRDSAVNNREMLDYMCTTLSRAVRDELTPKQFRAIALYYVNKLTMREVAELLGVSVPTVSRTIKRGRARLQRCLRYCAPEYFRRAEK